MRSWLKTLTILAATAMALTLATGAMAKYPTKPVTLVSPYGPGGAADLAARNLSATVPALLGQSIMVVNRTGAAGVTGSAYVAKSTPNGYTLLLARVGCQAAVPALNQRIPYKWDDFTFLGLLELNPFVLTVNPNSPYKTLDDVKNALKSGKKLSYSTAGVGTLLHLGMVVLLDELGVEQTAAKHIPFKGGGKAGAACVGGHVDMFLQNLSGVISHIQGGKLRALAVTTKKRVPSLPNVPTFQELGYPGMNIVVGWSALYGPKGLPKDVVDKWVSVLQKLKTDKAWLKITNALGSVPMIESPAETKKFVEAQYLKFKKITEKLGMTIK